VPVATEKREISAVVFFACHQLWESQ